LFQWTELHQALILITASGLVQGLHAADMPIHDSHAKSKIIGLSYYPVRNSKRIYQARHLGHVAQENQEDQVFPEYSCNQYTRELHHLEWK